MLTLLESRVVKDAQWVELGSGFVCTQAAVLR